MIAASVQDARRRPWSAPRALAIGTLLVGVIDGLDAIVVFGLRGVAPGRVFQGIASGLLGREAFQGGASTVALGVLLHFFIAFAIVAVYFAASRRISVLWRRPIECGLAYGVAAYFVMSQIVVPLAIGRGPFVLPLFVNGVLIHAFGVGLPAALVAARASRT